MLVGQALQDFCALGKAARNRQLADIAANAQQPARVDDRTDIVQHRALDDSRARRGERHDEEPAARGADEDGALRPAGDQHLHQVVELDADVVVLPVAVVLGEAAPAIVERQHPPRLRLVLRESQRHLVEVGRGAGQPGRQTTGIAGEASGP